MRRIHHLQAQHTYRCYTARHRLWNLATPHYYASTPHTHSPSPQRRCSSNLDPLAALKPSFHELRSATVLWSPEFSRRYRTQPSPGVSESESKPRTNMSSGHLLGLAFPVARPRYPLCLPCAWSFIQTRATCSFSTSPPSGTLYLSSVRVRAST